MGPLPDSRSTTCYAKNPGGRVLGKKICSASASDVTSRRPEPRTAPRSRRIKPTGCGTLADSDAQEPLTALRRPSSDLPLTFRLGTPLGR